jgi:hypothetical protein
MVAARVNSGTKYCNAMMMMAKKKGVPDWCGKSINHLQLSDYYMHRQI